MTEVMDLEKQDVTIDMTNGINFMVFFFLLSFFHFVPYSVAIKPEGLIYGEQKDKARKLEN